ncbi:predicted protein [Naegleria gruberi]|uniref:Predicted protein n=1 Tax=Naegleria gruberi TaxID=5762 RepID=D2V4F2_NAEGR|nr:uncharacterized protein NAEGRDRAFT_63704 [Naegleria gruberi]EFC48504.1 predicted protein [Naegleria gruberi]|eukprot:XP_002681248.1 predicted protein [Naegleria gruberi strain NEG-M]
MARRKERQKDKQISEQLIIHDEFSKNQISKRFLILGGTNSGKSTFCNFLRVNNDIEWLLSIGVKLDRWVMEFVFRCILVCYELLKNRLPNQFEKLKETIRKDIRLRTISNDLIKFIRYVREGENEFLLEASFHMRYLNNIKYFFSEEFIAKLENNSQMKFELNDMYRVKIPRTSSSIKEIDIKGGFNFRFIDPSDMRGEPRKWITQFENVDVVYYFISLADYVLHDTVHNTNCLQLAIDTFENLKKSELFSSFVIFLTKTDELAQLLEHHPFSDYFKEYTGQNTKEEVIRYIQYQCVSTHTRTCTMYVHAVNLTDTSKFTYILAETYQIHNNLVVF